MNITGRKNYASYDSSFLNSGVSSGMINDFKNTLRDLEILTGITERELEEHLSELLRISTYTGENLTEDEPVDSSEEESAYEKIQTAILKSNDEGRQIIDLMHRGMLILKKEKNQ